jgi:hypothetical protein
MDLSEKIFGKSLALMTLADLQNYFKEEREESQILEFKSGDIKISDLYKEICAFLNSDGGIIIIGSPREKKVVRNDQFIRICQGKLTPSIFKSKKWIEEHIAKTIEPFAEGIEIKEFSNLNESHYIIEVPKSKTPPHQFKNEGRYYIRVYEEARPAPHKIIRSLFLRNVKPVFNIYILFKHHEFFDNQLQLDIIIENSSVIPAFGVMNRLEIINIASIIGEGTWEISDSGESYVYEKKMETYIVDEITTTLSFEIEHKFQPFIVYVMVWNEEAGICKKGILYDPENQMKLIDTDKVEGKNPDLNLLKKHLIEIVSYL